MNVRNTVWIVILFCGIVYIVGYLYGEELQRKLSAFSLRIPEQLSDFEFLFSKFNFENIASKKNGQIAILNRTILFYTTFFGDARWGLPQGSKVFQDLECPVQNCILSSKTSLMNISDAVFFHGEQLPERPPKKYSTQKWIFFDLESPQKYKLDVLRKKSNYWKNLFNYTSTYRSDSDFPCPYGLIKKRGSKQRIKRDYSKVIRQKKRLIAWFVSNCGAKSERMLFARTLKKYIPVDIYGCGYGSCPKSMDAKCLAMLNTTYKFYFAAENSICQDYVTEKFFKYFPLDIVLVVRGGANYSKLFPSNAYINAFDFPTVKSLADYLVHLDRNPKDYEQYLKKKDCYYVSLDFMRYGIPWCKLCKTLNADIVSEKYYADIVDWWRRRGCIKPPDLHKLLPNTNI